MTKSEERTRSQDVVERPAEPMPAVIRHLSIGEGRRQISDLVKVVGRTWSVFSLGSRTERTALLAPYELVAPLLESRPEPLLALAIARKFLPDAPVHLVRPMLEELRGLSSTQLLALFSVHRLPPTSEEKEMICSVMGGDRVLDRLNRRHEIAAAIAEARKEGLYDATEHYSGMLPLEVADQTEEETATTKAHG